MLSLRHNKLKRLYKKAKTMFDYRQHNQVSDHVIRKEIDLYYAMAKLYDKLKYNKNYPYATYDALKNYRAAAMLNDVNAQYIVGERLCEMAKYWDAYKATIYASRAHENYAKAYFEEALAFFESAEKAGHTQAKRMKGLLLINGWGVEKNTDVGLKLIIESIDKEGAWDKSTEIFGELGLNKPEFFTAIMSHRKSTTGQH